MSQATRKSCVLRCCLNEEKVNSTIFSMQSSTAHAISQLEDPVVQVAGMALPQSARLGHNSMVIVTYFTVVLLVVV